MDQSSRKRPRDRTDDNDGEFVPISKRINNLHIRINGDNEGQEDDHHEVPPCDKCHAMGATCPDHLFAATSNGYSGHPGASSAAAGGPSTSSNGHGLLSPHHHHHGGPGHDPYQQHLQQFQQIQQQQQQCVSVNGAVEQSGSSWNGSVHSMFQNGVGEGSEDGGGGGDGMPYEPDMDQNDNPFYYHVNELLYELHIARTNRLPKI